MTPARIGATVRFPILGTAFNVAGPIVGIGFIFFPVLAAAWVVAGWRSLGQKKLKNIVEAVEIFSISAPPRNPT